MQHVHKNKDAAALIQKTMCHGAVCQSAMSAKLVLITAQMRPCLPAIWQLPSHHEL